MRLGHVVWFGALSLFAAACSASPDRAGASTPENELRTEQPLPDEPSADVPLPRSARLSGGRLRHRHALLVLLGELAASPGGRCAEARWTVALLLQLLREQVGEGAELRLALHLRAVLLVGVALVLFVERLDRELELAAARIELR